MILLSFCDVMMKHVIEKRASLDDGDDGDDDEPCSNSVKIKSTEYSFRLRILHTLISCTDVWPADS